MSKRSVWFESVEVNRVLGIKHSESFSISDFVPGINLIYGPNGSGKSTIACVIRELLWPGQTGLERPTVSGHFHNGDQNWSIEIDAGSVESACGDDRGVTPDFGPVELSERYHLALHALIVEDNKDFAQEIFRSSQGGFDLEGAAKACGFDDNPRRPRALATTCNNQVTSLNEAKQRQATLATEYERLEQLEEERSQAKQAERDIALLEKAREYLVAKQGQHDIELELAALPDALERLHGDERTNLDTLDTRAGELVGKLEKERAKIETAENDILDLALPDEEVLNKALARLRTHQRSLATFELELREQNKTLSEARTAADIARNRLGDVFTDEQLAILDAFEVGGLAPFAREAAKIQAERAVVEEKRRWLEPAVATDIDAYDSDSLREGLTALAQWLAVPAGATSAPWWRSKMILGAVVAMTLVSVAFVLTKNVWWVVLLIPAISVITLELLHLWGRGARSAPSAQEVHQRSYEQTGLQTPASWEVDNVAEQVRVLARLLGSCMLEVERKQRREELEATENALEIHEAEIETSRAALSEKLGLSVGLEEQWLPSLVQNLIVWQEKTLAWEVAKSALDENIRGQQALIGDIATELQTHGLDCIEDAGTLSDAIQEIDERRTSRKNLNTNLKNARRIIDEVFEPELKTNRDDRNVLLERLQIEEGEEHLINAWLQDLKEFQVLQKGLASAKAVCSDHLNVLKGHDNLLDLEQIDIEERIEERQNVAERRDALSEEIAKINNTVNAAKAGFDLADCALELISAKAELAEMKEKGDAAISGAMLADWVRTVSVEKSRPQVFRRANELFVLFTKGVLQLDLDDATSPPRFLAKRGSEPGRPVDELSTGERVQLLMAIRIAFLEQNETACLPLLMDEVLGTSDDERVVAIIDTVVALARNGRQIFYFTAQSDEIGKWIARLGQESLEHRIIDLGRVRNLSAAKNAPLRIRPIKIAKIPAPKGSDHRAYAEILGVPNLDPSAVHLDALHLWHVIDDVKLLHQLLDRGILTWSQFRTLRDHGGTSLVDVDGEHLSRIEATARAAEAACAAWRVGRGKPVDRAALQDAGCVSDSFIDEITELAAKVDGVAESLIDALAGRAVARWRQPNTYALREYFEAEGYLSLVSPLTFSSIRIQTQAAVKAELRDGVIDDVTVDRLVGSLPQV